MTTLLSDNDVIDRIFQHIDNKTTDLGETVWKEPVENYMSQERFEKEIELLRRMPVPYCPSAALLDKGSYIARKSAGRPLLVVRGEDGVVRAFKNACRHRGMKLKGDESGCTKAFVCPYHAWTYGLDGALKHIPGNEAFPGINKEDHGLVPVHSVVEKNGVVFVTQDEPISEGCLESIPDLFSPEQKVFEQSTMSDSANWKLLGETSMEGYHIKSLHNKSFYPYGVDNINVIETFGRNSRVTFPFRRIEKLREIPREERRIDGMVTYVIQLFPNCHITTLSSHSILIILEPVSPNETEWVVYRLTNKLGNGPARSEADTKKDADFVKNAGLDEDRYAAQSIQDSLETGANEFLTFGQCESAIVHFHKHLDDQIACL
ncbi:aromatic ring-hydroxylating oxygenase subunit alpha [Sneathiella aquimaris]|uniref:aromatic ring-hydroxylating oxygenase subunit alpha n=1 Tax=Sneathiella aquimaris TaxID=2599305 RepID=UPI00146BFDFB|nr:aromatic ring-hydroxylating dioxygenase subunit alpha [Sneathiella aquimaris]